MEDVISKLAEIETAASRIMEDVTEQKKMLAKENEEQMKAFDKDVDGRTEKKLEELRKELEIDMKQEVEKQRLEAQGILDKMTQYYEKNHEELAQKLYDKILRM